MTLGLLDVVFWLPTATLPRYEGALTAVVGAAATTSQSLDWLPAGPDQQVCRIDTLRRLAVATDAEIKPGEVFE